MSRRHVRLHFMLCLSALMSPVLVTRGQAVKAGSERPHLFNRVIALCVGIDEYRFIGQTPFAEADAKAVGDLLRAQYGFTPDVSLLGTRATKANILARIDEYARTLKEQDVFILFFAGHGQVINLPTDAGRPPRGEGFLLPYEARLALDDHRDPDAWRREAIGMQEILKRVEGMRVQHALVIVDACCSGFMTRRGSLMQRHDLRYLLTHQSRAVLAATTDNQIATPDEQRGHGQFTGAFLDELRNWASRKEAASLTDVFENVRFQVSKATRSGMVPQMNARLGDGNGEFVFIPLSVRKSDVDAVVRSVRADGTASGGRGHILSAVLERAQERENLKTTEQEVVEASESLNYRYSTEAAARAAYWEAKFKRFHENASLGDANAMTCLFYSYSKGLGTEPDGDAAFRWAKAAYDTGDAAGIHVLGECYANGIGVPENEEAGLDLFRDGSDKGFVLSRFIQAATDFQKTDKADEELKALQLLEDSMNNGSARARFLVARIYRDGSIAIPKNIDAAIRVLEPDSPQHDPRILYFLYELFSQRKQGYPAADLVRAEKWLRESAAAGHADAQLLLACELHGHGAFAHNLGLREDPAAAFKWARFAAGQGLAPAHLLLSHLYEHGEGTDLNHELARKHCETAADSNLAQAFTRQAVWYWKGTLYPEDLEKAKKLFELAFRRGDNEAYYIEAKYLEQAYNGIIGGGGRPPLFARMAMAEPLHLYVQAAKRGHEPSRKEIAREWSPGALEALKDRYPRSASDLAGLRENR